MLSISVIKTKGLYISKSLLIGVKGVNQMVELDEKQLIENYNSQFKAIRTGEGEEAVQKAVGESEKYSAFADGNGSDFNKYSGIGTWILQNSQIGTSFTQTESPKTFSSAFSLEYFLSDNEAQTTFFS